LQCHEVEKPDLFQPHAALSTTAEHGHLGQFQLIFLHDALVRLAVAFDAVLELAVSFWKRRKNLIGSRHRVTQRTGPAETDHSPDRKATARGRML
jgi:hypothetical protein